MTATEVRKRAWITRRARYGPAGHRGVQTTYKRPRAADQVGRRALDLVIKLHLEAVLSEGQCCKALGLDRVAFRKLVDEGTR